MCAYKRPHDIFAAESLTCSSMNLQTQEEEDVPIKKPCYWKDDEDSAQNNDDVQRNYDLSIAHDDDMEEERLPNINEIKLDEFPIEGIYPRKPKYGRKIDLLIDDIIRKSQRQSESQNNYALIPTPDTAIWIPPTIGPHPTTDHRFISRHPSSNETIGSNSQSHHDDTTTHSEFFISDETTPSSANLYLSLRNQSNRNRDDSSSDEYEDMVVMP